MEGEKHYWIAVNDQRMDATEFLDKKEYLQIILRHQIKQIIQQTTIQKILMKQIMIIAQIMKVKKQVSNKTIRNKKMMRILKNF